MPYGIVTHFQFSKNIGFIRCPELNKENIYFHISQCIPGYDTVQIGDEVDFDLHAIDLKRSEARAIALLGNSGLDELISSYQRRLSRTGRLVKFGKRYFAEDDQTGIFIRIEFGENGYFNPFESEQTENQRIHYLIDSIKKRNDLTGILLIDEIKDELQPVLNGESTDAIVTEIVKGGFSIRFMNSHYGFIPYKLATRFQPVINPGDLLDVTLIKADLKTENFVFDLTQNLQDKENRRINRIRAIPKFRIGDVITGTISHAVSYGVFVSLGETDGFLHLSEILGESEPIPPDSRRSMSDAMTTVFRTGTPIEVEIRQLSKDKITLTWDPMSASNYILFDLIFSHYKKLKDKNMYRPLNNFVVLTSGKYSTQ